ncbi:unnamed protein product [Gongylonema pulchrum]|uniref:Kazrin n=1 Tax=Gongylonema pulchrum TaxID=637853 RepID=A0A183E114_9BILA|nr:unnamed protein product [Gongylonema pulchrum]
MKTTNKPCMLNMKEKANVKKDNLSSASNSSLPSRLTKLRSLALETRDALDRIDNSLTARHLGLPSDRHSLATSSASSRSRLASSLDAPQLQPAQQLTPVG